MLKHTGKFAAVSVLIATLTLLSACSTFSRMEQGLDALVGKQDKTAFLILGKPASQTNTNNYKQYTWLIHRPDVAIEQVTINRYNTIESLPLFETLRHKQLDLVNNFCEIKLTADHRGTINSWSYDGNSEGCRDYIHRLGSFFQRHRDIAMYSDVSKGLASPFTK